MLHKIMDTISGARRQISRCYQNIMVHPRTTEEEKAMYNFAVRLLHIMYYATGGVYFAQNLSSQTKRTFYAVNFGAAFLVVLSYLYLVYGLLSGLITIDLLEIARLVAPTAVYLYYLFYLPGLTFIFRNEIERIMSYVSVFEKNFQKINFRCQNKTFSGKLDRKDDLLTNDLFMKRNFLMFPLIMYLGTVSVNFIYQAYPIIAYTLVISDERSSNIRDYNTIPLPFYDCVQSKMLYCFLSTTAATIMACCVSVIATQFAFLSLLGNLMKHIALIMGARMCSLSETFTQQYETILLNVGRDPQEIASRSFLVSAFENDLNILLGEHQECCRSFRILKPFITVVLTLMITSITVVMLASIFLLLMVDLNAVQILDISMACFTLAFGAFQLCYFGKTLDETGELYRYAVYNLPWYYLPPKMRKVINIFQSMVFNSDEIKVLGVYPVNMAMFPRLWNSVFSYANILRVAVEKRS